MISLGFITPDTMRATESVALRQDEYPEILFLVRSEIVTLTKPPQKAYPLHHRNSKTITHTKFSTLQGCDTGPSLD